MALLLECAAGLATSVTAAPCSEHIVSRSILEIITVHGFMFTEVFRVTRKRSMM